MLIIAIDPGISGSLCFFEEGKINSDLINRSFRYEKN